MLEQDLTKSVKAKPQSGEAKKTTAARKSAAGGNQTDLQQRIQQRAYELWESEGRPEGREHAHWQQAQNEIARTRGQRAGAKL